MSFGIHKICGVERVCISLDALKANVQETKANLKSIRLGPKSRGLQYICPECDAYALRMEFTDPTPFLCADGVVRTVEDIDWERKGWLPNQDKVAGFSFSPTALTSILKLIDRARELPDGH